MTTGHGDDPFSGVRGEYEVTIEVKTPSDDDYDEVIIPPDARWGTTGESLRELRQHLGGDEGFITNVYTGRQHRVSIAHLRDFHPDETRCFVVYRFVPDPSDGDKYQEASRRFVAEE
jgi:hypothetical protein